MTAIIIRTVPAGLLEAATAAALRWCRGTLDAWRESRRLRAERLNFDALDDVVLRDMGLRRSEYDSYLAEASGLAPWTRTRVVRGIPRHPWP
jgi:hypothetical protein